MKRLNFDTLSAGAGMMCLMALAASTVSAQYGPKYVGAPAACGSDHCTPPSGGTFACGAEGCYSSTQFSSGSKVCCIEYTDNYTGAKFKRQSTISYTDTFCFLDCDKDNTFTYQNCTYQWNSVTMSTTAC